MLIFNGSVKMMIEVGVIVKLTFSPFKAKLHKHVSWTEQFVHKYNHFYFNIIKLCNKVTTLLKKNIFPKYNIVLSASVNIYVGLMARQRLLFY